MTTSAFAPLVLGGASYGGLYRAISDEDAQASLNAAWDGGIRAFDTAPHYGAGLSEERLGEFLRGKPRDEFVISTKVGRLLVDDPTVPDGESGFFGAAKRRRVEDYSAAGVRRSLEESLTRLGLDRVNLLLIHDPENHMQQAMTEAVAELVRMRAEGLVDGIGVGVNFADDALRFAEQTPIDHLMIAGRYSLLDRRAETDLLPACQQRGISVLAAGVMNSGLLADPDKQATFNYSPAPDHLVAAAKAMQQACSRYGVPLRAAALQFPTRSAAVSALVTGAGTVRSITDTFQQLTVPIPDELWTELDQLVPPGDTLPD
jgi:D-threo-aldose 1-dehydrogenase